MCNVSFGDGMQIDQALDDLIDKAPRLCSTDVQLLLRDRYETISGIYDHDKAQAMNATHPFALILHHWNEDTVENSPLHERIKQYTEFQIHRHFALSLDEFLDRPTYMCELLLKIAAGFNRKEAPIIQGALDELNGKK